MATVTLSDSDSPGTRLIKLQEQAMLEHPHLTPQHARALVFDQHPDLVALHNQGWPDLDPPAPTIDPGVRLNEKMHQLLQSGEARNRSEAYELACRALPEEGEAHKAGLRMPATAETREHAESQVTWRERDPGIETMRLMHEAMAADRSLSRSAAQQKVFRENPVLKRHYVQGEDLPVATETPRSSRELFVEEALVAAMALRKEVDKLAAPTRQRQRARALPPPRVARLAQAADKIGPPVFFTCNSGGML